VLTVRGLRRAVCVATGAVAASLMIGLSACSGATGDRSPGPATPMVAVGRRLFSLTWEGDDVCVHGAYPALPACLTVDVDSTEAVLSALVEPLEPAADLLLVVTRPEVALAGLGPGVVRTVMAAASGDDQVAVSVGLRPAPTPTVCALVETRQGRAALVVHRAVAVAAGRAAEGADDDC
jgi:hypothetical protein